MKIFRITLMLSLLSLSLIHISEPTRRTPISYAVFCLKKEIDKQYYTEYNAHDNG